MTARRILAMAAIVVLAAACDKEKDVAPPAELVDFDPLVQVDRVWSTGTKGGDDVRGGVDHKEVLATYTGSVPASAVSAIIPGASGDFDATYGIASDGELRQVELTGTFYSGEPANTYTMVLSDYGTRKDVTAP